MNHSINLIFTVIDNIHWRILMKDLSLVTSYNKMTPSALLKYAFVMERNLSCPSNENYLF